MNASYIKKESFSTVDGPGIRTVYFLSGCPYRCIYCHNPESFFNINTKKITVDEIIKDFLKNKTYYKNGGITISGGEPLLHYEFCCELAKKCFSLKISLAIDTCGFHNKLSVFDVFIKYKVLFLIDIKHTIKKYHKIITQKSETLELNLIKYLEQKHHKYWVRMVYGIGLTDQPKNISNIKKIINNTKYLERFEILPLHLLAEHKYEELKIPYKITKKNVPSIEQIKNIKILFKID
ncbi:MAG: radical SAM protein [Mycoplasmataceae bacterium]|jgi:pyruvate formate lyase activating enzyme|nr:radical SAM protein [Mycoplasmataceae bacterium]